MDETDNYVSAAVLSFGESGAPAQMKPRWARAHQPRCSLEPEISHAATVAWQIIERVQPIEMIDRKIRDGFRGRQSNIHSYAPSTVLLQA
jgi:hypothetical protein